MSRIGGRSIRFLIALALAILAALLALGAAALANSAEVNEGSFLSYLPFISSTGPESSPAGDGDNIAGGVDCTPSVSQTEVRDGVVLSWEGSFFCADVSDTGDYSFTINVFYVSGGGSVTIENALLIEKTPKPQGQVPAGGLDEVHGLPFTIDPGQEASFTVSGSYGLVQTDEGKKASFHFEAPGNVNGELFALGFNGHFRAPGATP